MKSVFLALLFLLPFSVLSQQEVYLKANGIITSIEKKRTKKRVKEIATVFFTTQKGETIETIVEIERLPLLGSFKSVGDAITINYNEKNPLMAETNVGSFISKYGMYILVALGIIFSARTYLKAIKK